LVYYATAIANLSNNNIPSSKDIYQRANILLMDNFMNTFLAKLNPCIFLMWLFIEINHSFSPEETILREKTYWFGL